MPRATLCLPTGRREAKPVCRMRPAPCQARRLSTLRNWARQIHHTDAVAWLVHLANASYLFLCNPNQFAIDYLKARLIDDPRQLQDVANAEFGQMTTHVVEVGVPAFG